MLPQKYELLIKMNDYDSFPSQPNDAAIFYNGEVTITFQLTESKDTILLHKDASILLNQTSVRLQSVSTGNFLTITHGYYEEIVDLYQVKASNGPLALGMYKLSMSFFNRDETRRIFQVKLCWIRHVKVFDDYSKITLLLLSLAFFKFILKNSTSNTFLSDQSAHSFVSLI